MSIKTHTLIPVPFANNAGSTYRYSITQKNETEDANKATFDDGFPAVTMQAIEAGGIPMFGQDFNGMFYLLTSAIREIQAGNWTVYNSNFAKSIGGYATNAVVLGSDGKFYQATKDSVTTNPVSDKTNWKLWLNFLPLSGGTVTGNLNVTGTLKKNNVDVFTVGGGTVTGNTNFTKTPTINTISILKQGDGGLLSYVKTVYDMFSDDITTGFYRFEKDSINTPVANSYGYINKICWNTTEARIMAYMHNSHRTFTGFKDKNTGNISFVEFITTENVGDYVTQNLEYWYVNGSESKPATITTNQEIILSNPYVGKAVLLIPQVYITGRDGKSRWIDCPFNYENSLSSGVSVNQIETTLYIVGADSSIFYSKKINTGLPESIAPPDNVSSASFRIKIIK